MRRWIPFLVAFAASLSGCSRGPASGAQTQAEPGQATSASDGLPVSLPTTSVPSVSTSLPTSSTAAPPPPAPSPSPAPSPPPSPAPAPPPPPPATSSSSAAPGPPAPVTVTCLITVQSGSGGSCASPAIVSSTGLPFTTLEVSLSYTGFPTGAVSLAVKDADGNTLGYATSLSQPVVVDVQASQVPSGGLFTLQAQAAAIHLSGFSGTATFTLT